MAISDIHAGNGRVWTLAYKQTDGSNGTTDPNTPPEITMVPPDGATVTAMPFNTQAGTQDFNVEHNTGVGSVDITIVQDGDLGAGVVQITATETFNMLAPGGAASVQSTVGAERPTP